MSYYPIQLDKSRNFKYGMKAISLIEKKFKKPIMKIEGMIDAKLLTMDDLAIIMWAGLVHEDNKLTSDKVMELVDEHSNMYDASVEMWKAFNANFGPSKKIEEDKEEETEGKNE